VTIPQPPHEPQNPEQSGPPLPVPPQPAAPAAPTAQAPQPYGQQPYGQQPPAPGQPGEPQYTRPDPYGQAAPQAPQPYQQPQNGQQPGYAPQPGYTPQGGYAPAAAPTETLAIIGLVGAFVFWPAGIIISPMALSKIKKNGKGGRGLALAGLIVSIVAAIISIISIVISIISIIASAAAVNGLIESTENMGTTEASVAVGEIGQTESGSGYRVDAVECGIAAIGEAPSVAEPQGEYCKVDVTFINNGTEPTYFSTSYASGFIGDAEYTTDSTATLYADDSDGAELFGAEVNPGNEMAADLYFDIPAGETLERVVFTSLTFTDGDIEVVL